MEASRLPGEAAKRRDAGLRRLRRLTRGAVVLGAAGVGILASVAAGSSTGHRAARVPPAPARATAPVATQVPAPAATVPVEEAAAPATPPSQPASPPTVASAPPVVVSGGS